jgi:hypothetical protein
LLLEGALLDDLAQFEVEPFEALLAEAGEDMEDGAFALGALERSGSTTARWRAGRRARRSARPVRRPRRAAGKSRS